MRRTLVVALATGLVALLGLPSLAAAGVVQTLAATTTPAAKAAPVTLAAGATGTTTLGSSATSASTTKSGLSTAQEVLLVKKGTSSWDVQVKLLSVSGFGALDAATVELVLGATTQVQDVVGANGAVTQSIGTPVTLPAGGSDLSVKVLGTKLSGGTSTLHLQVLAVPTGASVPAMAYTYTLAVTT